MPDKAKLEALAQAGYKIKKVCGSCVHFIGGESRFWGRCQKIPYKHEKHSEAESLASVHTSGSCRGWEPHPTVEQGLFSSGFDRFREGEHA